MFAIKTDLQKQKFRTYLGVLAPDSGVAAPGFILARNFRGDTTLPSLSFLSFTFPRSTFVLPLALSDLVLDCKSCTNVLNLVNF